MRERPSKPAPFTVDAVLVTAMEKELAILLVRNSGDRERWSLPWRTPQTGETLDAAAATTARDALGEPPAWVEQIGAFGDGKRHPGEADVSVAYLGLVPHETASPRAGHTWFRVDDLPPLAPRQRAMVEGATETLQSSLDQAPIAFRLLPAAFTLSELQQMYELLLGKRLHKASFRRALQAAWLVEPMDEWRSEGRGRPAQLFRYLPKKKRRPHRGVRFDFLYP
ncbi:MAG TPA: NUDIX domain-containing protein [Gemmatimonadaceae bacterium]|jgi:8-oxo-dGTP diphosphatase|nr:NUDIX domain-containing protein [Gemmatimonadaceae bacterium]